MEIDNYCKQRSCGTASVNPKTRTNRKISVVERNRENQNGFLKKTFVKQENQAKYAVFVGLWDGSVFGLIISVVMHT